MLNDKDLSPFPLGLENSGISEGETIFHSRENRQAKGKTNIQIIEP